MGRPTSIFVWLSVVVCAISAISDSRIRVSVHPESSAVFAPVSVRSGGGSVSIVEKFAWLLILPVS